MPTKKSAKKTIKPTGKTRHKNRSKGIILIGVFVLIVCVLVAGGCTIYSLISTYQATHANISNFTIITEEDKYNTIAMNDEYLEVIASDWGAPAINRQVKINLKDGKTQAIVHYGRTTVGDCDEVETNCIEDEVYYGKLDQGMIDQISTTAKDILKDQEKSTFGLGQYDINESLIELCKNVINELKEN